MYIAPEGKHVYGLLINEPLPKPVFPFSRFPVFPFSSCKPHGDGGQSAHDGY